MADWELTFRMPTHASIKVDACQQLLASIYGTEPSTTYGPVEGNPYDSYWGGITVETTSADGAIRVVLCSAAIRAWPGRHKLRWSLSSDTTPSSSHACVR